MFLVEWMKVQNIEISECNSLLKTEIPIRNQFTISKINNVLKNSIHEQEPDLISLNHLIYVSAVISVELCNIKIKALKRNMLGKNAFKNK